MLIARALARSSATRLPRGRSRSVAHSCHGASVFRALTISYHFSSVSFVHIDLVHRAWILKVVVGGVGLFPVEFIVAALVVVRKRSKAALVMEHEAGDMQASLASPAQLALLSFASLRHNLLTGLYLAGVFIFLQQDCPLEHFQDGRHNAIVRKVHAVAYDATL